MTDDLHPYDCELLAAYAQHGDEQAFREIVGRYASLVHGVALRKTGSTSLAEEIAQNTFAVLARKAKHLRNRKTLGGWLVTTARLEAARVYRSESRRQRKMNAYSNEPEANNPSTDSSSWDEAIPYLDDALAKLSEREREVIVLRFYQKRSYREIGAQIGNSEDGSRKRVSRAVAVLGKLLAKQGHVLPAAAIVSGLGIQFSKATPLVSASTLAIKALGTAPSISALTLITNTIHTMTLSKQIVTVAVIVVATLATGVQWNKRHQLRAEVAMLREHYEDRLSPASLVPSERSRTGLELRVSPPVNANTGAVAWDELIALFNKMNRFNSDAAKDLFYAKLRALDEREQFRADDLEATLETLRAHGAPGMMLDLMASTLAMFAAERDPEGMANLLLANDDFPRFRMGIALENWGKKEPYKAMEWFRARREEGALAPHGAMETDSADSEFGSLIAGVAQGDLSLAMDLLRDAEEKSITRALYRLAFVFDEPAQRARLTNALNSESDAALRTQVVSSYAKSLTEMESPDSAWQYLNEVNLGEQERRAVMSEAIRFESQRDYKAAPRLLEWVGAHAAWFEDQKAIGQAVAHWQLVDKKAAKAWAEAHPHLLQK